MVYYAVIVYVLLYAKKIPIMNPGLAPHPGRLIPGDWSRGTGPDNNLL